jgi:F0F1-type ATP synthase assembly protein I
VDSSQRRELNEGFGDGLQQAFELVVTPAIFGVLGFLLDRWLGTVPLFTIVFTLFVLSYMGWKVWATYQADMRAAEAGKPWARTRASTSATELDLTETDLTETEEVHHG